MHKRTLFFIIIIAAAGLLFGYLKLRKWTDTPGKFLNQTLVEKGVYTRDSVRLMAGLRERLQEHEGFFNNTAYFDGTQPKIDTIIYSPDLSKLGVLVLVKNPTNRQLVPDKGSDWYYDATCYLAVRRGDSLLLAWIGPNFSNSPSEQAVSEDIRDACFKYFVSQDTNSVYKYNLNDIRFWNSPIWKKVEKEIERK